MRASRKAFAAKAAPAVDGCLYRPGPARAFCDSLLAGEGWGEGQPLILAFSTKGRKNITETFSIFMDKKGPGNREQHPILHGVSPHGHYDGSASNTYSSPSLSTSGSSSSISIRERARAQARPVICVSQARY